MQNNGLIRLFAILFGFVSIYQLSFTFIASQKEAEAKEFAISKYSRDVTDYINLRDKAYNDYLDSIGSLSICLLYTSPSPRDRQKSRMPSSA